MKVSWAEMEASQDSLVAPTCGNERAAKCAFSWGKLGNSGKKASPAASPAASANPQRCGGPLARVVVTAYSPYSIRWVRCRHCRALKAEHCQPPPAPYLFSWFQVSKPSSIAIFRGHRSSGPAPIIYRAKCLLAERGGVLGFRAGNSTFVRVRGGLEGLLSWLFILVSDVERQRRL